MTTVPEALTVPEVMAALRLSRNKVYDLLRARELRSFTVGRSRRIAVESLADFIRRQVEENN
ncbi:DNA-binding protein [Streptacidiphilus pinicola]|uniref:DNA-binding protein n=1 Tax=Streptacidiphilus pinicola TaxID=2219663 RepID=A0A2X0IE76_9ACTN|nr:helix-turn-helix domain-containing protein [Streptacidiphilus pinicola]RAG81731.1 DNA-binding protein [Streptacidiphilus pinicola]